MPLVLVILTKNSYMGNQIGMKYEIKHKMTNCYSAVFGFMNVGI